MTAHADPYDKLLHNLTNHAPHDDTVVERFQAIREAAKSLGVEILDLAPDCRERSLALTNLEQTVMWAVAAIARRQDDLP